MKRRPIPIVPQPLYRRRHAGLFLGRFRETFRTIDVEVDVYFLAAGVDGWGVPMLAARWGDDCRFETRQSVESIRDRLSDGPYLGWRIWRTIIPLIEQHGLVEASDS